MSEFTRWYIACNAICLLLIAIATFDLIGVFEAGDKNTPFTLMAIALIIGTYANKPERA